MGLLDKVKNFFYDDEEVEEEEEEIEVPVRVHKKEKRESSKEEVSERELFRAERTFNFPINVDDDENMFETQKNSIKEEKVEINNSVNINSYRSSKPKDNAYAGLRAYSKVEPKKEEIKRFRPTPVISPIYGVLDKNYKKEDIMVDSALESNSKKIDYDTVRKRAYGNIYKTEPEEIDEPEEDTKGIFYNLDEEEKNDIVDNNDEEVKIIYNDVTFEDENLDDNKNLDEEEGTEDSVLINQEESYDEDNILSETKEQDLFNLIDNMYNSDDEEEEEEE